MKNNYNWENLHIVNKMINNFKGWKTHLKKLIIDWIKDKKEKIQYYKK